MMTITSEPAGTMSERVRAASMRAHRNAETSSVMRRLLDGELTTGEYRFLLAQYRHVYRSLEAANDDLRAHPTLSVFHFEALARVSSIDLDLACFDDGVPPPEASAATLAYCDRIDAVAHSWPAGIVAHHYVRYFGDLSGGQLIGQRVAESFDLSGIDGVRFYHFAGIADPDAFKNTYRALLDSAFADGEDQERFIAEVQRAYAHNSALLAE